MISGPALVLGDDVNTDELHPSRFYSLDDATVRAGFLGAVGPEKRGIRTPSLASPRGSAAEEVPVGPVVVAGANFGVGSSRETGARVFLLAGVRAIVARSFARIFFRNASNLGIPVFVCPELVAPAPGDVVLVDLERGEVRCGGRTFPIAPPDAYWAAVCAAGGLARYLGLEPVAAGDRAAS